MVIIETPTFTRQILELLSDDAYRALQTSLINRPEAGKLIPGGAGLRKHRFGAKGKGKRGGGRVIYYWIVDEEQILMLLAYPKNERDDVSKSQLETLTKLVKDYLYER
jgi:hypothetical protein